jgi:hypothetical protein
LCSTFPLDIPGRPWGKEIKPNMTYTAPLRSTKPCLAVCVVGKETEKVPYKDGWGLMLPQSGAHSSKHIAWLLWLWPQSWRPFCAGDTDPKKDTLPLLWILEANGEWPWGSQVERYLSFHAFDCFLFGGPASPPT